MQDPEELFRTLLDADSHVRPHILQYLFADMCGVTATLVGTKLELYFNYWSVYLPSRVLYRIWQAASVNAISQITVQFSGWGELLVVPDIIRTFVAELVCVAPGVPIRAIMHFFKDGKLHSIHNVQWWVERVSRENGLMQVSRSWELHNKNIADCYRFQSVTLHHLG